MSATGLLMSEAHLFAADDGVRALTRRGVTAKPKRRQTAVAEEVYRHQLKPVITKGAEIINAVFKKQSA